MEEHVSSSKSEHSESLPSHEVLILHTAEAQEWATYLQQILKSSRKFPKRSILLYAISSADELHGYNFECFQRCKCIVLLLSGVFFDILYDHELQGALQGLLYPPHRVVVLLCGVSEEPILTESFQDWPIWRKLYADDEPALYVSTILESIADSRQVEAEHEREAAAAAAAAAAASAAAAAATAAAAAAAAAAASASTFHIIEATSPEYPTTDEAEEAVSEEEKETVLEDEEPAGTGNSTLDEISPPTHLTCLTVQPNRVMCGKQETLYIIFTHKVDDQSTPEVEFSSDNVAVKRVPGTVENEYTISVIAPDMPTGMVSLTMHTDQSCVSLSPVTYYTSMGEVSRCLENAADPVNFLCQAFNLTSNATESLDELLTDSFKSRMAENGLKLFGIRQIEKENMSTYQRDEELPTLLHFAAKYGLKKLTDALLQCPGALQAYSVMNKDGDYPNTLAEKSGYPELREYIDEVVLSPETANVVNAPLEDTVDTCDTIEIYEAMSTSQDMVIKYPDCSEDIYESMLEIDPECAEDLYEEMNALDENREEVMLRKFFQAKPRESNVPQPPQWKSDEEEDVEQENFDDIEEEEDPYNLCPEDIYDTVDENTTYKPSIMNRPPAPIPRPENKTDSERPMTYISRVFSDKGEPESKRLGSEYLAARPAVEAPTPAHDPYAGMKTPGQRQLISLQERVKVGEITVDEAVQEFKAWQFDHESRAHSIRFQQENLKKLRDSITRRHKERDKTGKEYGSNLLGCEISAPLQRNLYWGSTMTLECAVYESAPRVAAPPPPPVQMIQRGGWKTGSTSSTSSTESNRLSTHSNFSLSSGTEPDFEDALENPPPPPRPPPRPSEAGPNIPPPRIPPRIPERVPEMVHERYISCPTRALPQRPSYRQTDSAPPLPRRHR